MKVFVSSLISGFEAERAATKGAITTLRHEAVMAEDFGAQPNSPQVACLQGLREADLVVLILGERYGSPQASGLSATHEEYREAKGNKPILAFVHEGVLPESDQQAFIAEVQEWEGGLFRQGYTDTETLRTGVTRALHDYELTTAQAPVDTDELRRRAQELLPEESGIYYSGSGPMLGLAIAGGPIQSIIRASMIEDQGFADRLQQNAQFGPTRIFEPSNSTQRGVEDDALVLRQDRGASIVVDEAANLVLQMPIRGASQGSRFSNDSSVIIEERVFAALRASLEFASQFLDEVDTTQRLSHVALAANLTGGAHRGWRTEAEHAASPNSIEIGHSSAERAPIALDMQRPALRLNRTRLIEDVIVRLRRQWRGR